MKPSLLAVVAAVLVLAGCKATKPDPEMFPEVQYSMQTHLTVVDRPTK